MRAYDFSTHNKTVKRDKSRYFNYAFIFLITLAIASFFYYVVANSPRILFYFRENKYSGIEKLHAAAIARIQIEKFQGNEDALKLSEVADFLSLASSLQKDHRDDPILHFHEATLLAEILRRQSQERLPAFIGIFFRDFIGRSGFPAEFDRELWQRALIAGRRARALGLTDAHAEKLAEVELETYAIAGRPWWESATALVGANSNARKLPAWHLIQAGLARETPYFELLKTAYGPILTHFIKGVYYMRSGNSPLGISSFREVAQNQTDAYARDHALYILGFLSGREKRVRDQLSYYKQIRFPEFAPDKPYFFNDYQFLLRFLGQKSEADQLMRAWEELKKTP